MNKKTIKFENPPNHINKYLTHWTGREKNCDEAFDTLCKIIKSKKLKFSRCNNGFDYKSGKKTSLPIVCFTDTPIEQSLEHCQRYNYFGISFNKEKMIECGANPVLYMVNNRIKHQELLFNMQSANASYFTDLKRYFYKNNEERNLFSWVLSITQPYVTKKVKSKGYSEYLEREWRIIRVLPTTFTKNTIETGGNYNEKLKQKIECEYEMKENEETCYLPFENCFIENIIVLNEDKYINQCESLMKEVGLTCDLILVDKTQLKNNFN